MSRTHVEITHISQVSRVHRKTRGYGNVPPKERARSLARSSEKPHERQKNDRIKKTCQHSAMKHRKQSKRAPQTHPPAFAVPSYHRILVKHGLIEKTLSIPDAYEVFLKVGADPEVQKLRRKVEGGSKIKRVPALYLATAMALQGMTKHELHALKLRIAKRI